MPSLLIVYHSMTGGTEQMVQAAASAARRQLGVRVLLSRAQDTGAAQLLSADGYIFASPENLAAMSGKMKDFFDRTYYAGLDRLNGRPYALLICAGSDGRSAAQQIERIAAGWRLRAVAAPTIVCTHAQATADILRQKHLGAPDLKACEDIGATLASGLALGIF
jgi:multimeric flavodoxin WrbA